MSSTSKKETTLLKRASFTVPMLVKWRGRVIFTSRLMPYTAQIDLPCYVSDRITRKPALTSAFGISRRAASRALVQSGVHESGFQMWVSLRRAADFAQAHPDRKFGAPFASLLGQWFKVSFFVHIRTDTILINVLDTVSVHENPFNCKAEHISIQVSLIETLSPSSLINLYSERDLNWPIQPQGIQVALLLQQTDMSLESRCDRGPNISYGAMSDYQVTRARENMKLSLISGKQACCPDPLQLSADALKNLAA